MNPFKGKKESKEEKKQVKLEELMARNNLQDLSQEDKESVKHILNQTLNSSFMALSFKAEDTAKIGLTHLMIEQNLIIIKLLNEISKKLDK